MNARGWGWTSSDIRQVQLIEWLAEQSVGHPNLFVDVKSFYDALPDQSENEVGVAYADLKHLEDERLITQASGVGGIESMTAMLTPQGRDFLEKLRARRANRVERRIACRDALVAWLYSVDATNDGNLPIRDDILKDPYHGMWLARPFIEADLSDASAWLDGQGLVTGIMVSGDPGPVRLFLTGAGVSCAEGFDSDTGRYLRRMERGSGPAVTIGHNSGSFQVAGDHAHQVQNVGASAEHLRELITSLAELVRQVAPDASGLDAEREAALAAARDGVVDQTALKRFGTWVLSIVGRGASAALTPAVTAATNEMLHEAARVAGHLT